MNGQGFTVGIPIYNSRPFIRESLESIIRQTVTPYEILLIDDGSTDGGIEEIGDILELNKNIRLISQENNGLTWTLNRMLRECHTPWLIRQDADDVSLPRRLELTLRAIERGQNSAVFYGDARYYRNGMAGARFRSTQAPSEKLSSLTREGHLLSVCHPTVALNVQKTIDIGGYRFDLPVEDIDLRWRVALSDSITYIPEDLLLCRVSGNSISSSGTEKQLVATAYIQYLLLSELLKLTPKTFAEVEVYLYEIIGVRNLNYRRYLKRANIEIGNKNFVTALSYLSMSFVMSPGEFAKRALLETPFGSSDETVTNDFPVIKFIEKSERLWGVRL